MKIIKKYFDYLNEASMDDTFETNDKKHFILFSDRIRKDFEENGGKYTIFYDFYNNQDEFFGLNLINRENVEAIKEHYQEHRFTFLGSVGYRDSDGVRRKKLSEERLENIIENSNMYYFYTLVEGVRSKNKAPSIQSIKRVVNSPDGKEWYFIIRKNRNCNLIKTKSREESGKWAEHQLSTLYGWRKYSKSIRLIIKKNGVAINRANHLLRTILKDEDADHTVFTVEDSPDTFVKYDLILNDDRKIEVKKYKEDSIWKNNHSVNLMLAEQCKMSDRRTLMKIVEWFNEKYKHGTELYLQSAELMEMELRELSNLFKSPNRPEICNIIKRLYNHNITKLLAGFNDIEESRWMSGVYGIYFVNNRTNRKNDFLIKIEDDGIRNINYQWDIVAEWAGFDRLKLFMRINGDAWEYILTEGNNFVKAFKLRDYKRFENARSQGHMILPPLEEGYDDRIFIYNNEHKWWEEI